jgi:hypothetical protein
MAGRWRFADSPETGVFTTRQAYLEGEPLGLVSHDVEGDWQFLHDEDEGEDGELRDEDDLMFVPLREIVARFPEVEQLADLPVGWVASREARGRPWVREPQPPEWAAD